MALVGRRGVALALEDVAEMAAAVGADDLGAGHAKGAVLVAGDGAGDAVKVGRPAAAGLELVVGRVERRLTAGAGVDARLGEVLVGRSRVGRLRALFPQDLELLCGYGQ